MPVVFLVSLKYYKKFINSELNVDYMHIIFLNKRLHLNGMESNIDWKLNVNDFCYKNIDIMPFI